ncbi:MAG TPA: GGDEF domain-containing protein [Phycisphaerae bacterium]|nr:GGDEF domain-containing protein [Phycisphaerae bacterium]HOJ76303.1 GGDEF domain-containing protein [Phycisphaerae bacterium]HOM53713.1 GGDEF domain-containing protein [Phycisphaerae bacterium]HON67891.1 GGDEF domain-containing protein [Phycisphaerae bacterium]HPP29081.1 GGDEF domain-containing protein [Phycisphaerae bacterium]
MAGLLEQLKKASRLPSPPGAALQILRLAQQEDVSLAEVAETLSSDPALSVRILKYANSALVGVAREITTVREAVVLLGMRTVRMMALSFSLVSVKDRRACPGFDYPRFWAHCLAHAVAARHLARKGRQVSPEEAFAAGLLASIGKLVFAVAMPAEYSEIIRQAGGFLADTAGLEQQRFGMNHQRAGAELLRDWGIPARLCAAVRYQSNLKDASLSADVLELATVVSEARPYIDIICAPPVQTPQGEGTEEAGPPRPGGHLEELIEAMRREFRELADLLLLDKTAELDVDQIQAEAGEVLSELSLAAQLRSDAVEREKQDLQERVRRDPLTGIANRGAFDRELDRMWQELARAHRSIGLILLDIDYFKRFNDRFGHRTGDAVLREVACCLPKCCRSVDFAARYGGEEFAILLPNADRLIAANVSVGIRRAVEALQIQFEGQSHRVTVSLGTAVLPRAGLPYTPQMLIDAADQQLYRSKGKGRNCCSMIQLPARPPEVLVGAV